NIAAKGVGPRELRHGFFKNPAVLPIASPEAIFQLVSAPSLCGFVIHFPAASPVARMNRLAPAIVQILILASPRKFEPPPASLHTPAPPIGGPNHDWGGVNQVVMRFRR